MNVEEVIQDMTSKDVTRIRRAGAEIIRNSQNEAEINKLLEFRKKIYRSTKGLELGGTFASNNRFYQFPLEIIDFYKGLQSFWKWKKECTCQLYLSKGYECFDPEKEAENTTIQLNVKIKGNWTHDYEIECLKCQNKFYVSERHAHYMWWKWIMITEKVDIQTSGHQEVDKELLFILSSIRTKLKDEPNHKNELQFQKSRLKDFRMKLAANKGTEFYETKYGWTDDFETLNNELDLSSSSS